MAIDLINILKEYGVSNINCVHEEIITNSTVTFLQLRDFLICSGEILYEDIENKVYVASVHTGILGLNRTILAIQICGSKVLTAGCSKEGLLKQSSLQKTYSKLKTFVQGKKTDKAKAKSKFKKSNIYGLIGLAVVVAVFIILLFIEVHQTLAATKAYNAAVTEYNKQVELYNQSVELTCIDNISDLPVVLESIKTEDESFFANLSVAFGDNNKDIITTDTKTIKSMTKQAKNAVSILRQITAPTGEWVTEKLSQVKKITGIQAVTKELDPDCLLGKEGGFSSCIYFTISDINSDEITGDSIVAKGTDAGGAVEVYPNVQDAEARCQYLAGFDGTALYSGSYAIIGTTVIRTSYKLNNEQQMELTNEITMALTSK